MAVDLEGVKSDVHGWQPATTTTTTTHGWTESTTTSSWKGCVTIKQNCSFKKRFALIARAYLENHYHNGINYFIKMDW